MIKSLSKILLICCFIFNLSADNLNRVAPENVDAPDLKCVRNCRLSGIDKNGNPFEDLKLGLFRSSDPVVADPNFPEDKDCVPCECKDDSNMGTCSTPGVGDCDLTCKLKTCGDGRKNRPSEECDDGTSNNILAPDQCRPSCELPKCDDGIIDSNEDCDRDIFKPGIQDLPGRRCVACKAVFASCCGDQQRQTDSKGLCSLIDLNVSLNEDCDGMEFKERPANIPPNVWDLRTCTPLCEIELPAYCQDGKKNGTEVCDPSVPVGHPDYVANCKSDCTLCQSNDSCGRPCGDPSYGQSDCCEGIPRPEKDQFGRSVTECRKVNSNSYCGGGWCSNGTGHHYVDGVLSKDANGNPIKCQWWYDQVPSGYQCKDIQEVCRPFQEGEVDGPIDVTYTTCEAKYEDVKNNPSCDPTKDPLCLEFELTDCQDTEEARNGLWNNGETCEAGSPNCVKLTRTTIFNNSNRSRECYTENTRSCKYMINSRSKLKECETKKINPLDNPGTCGISEITCKNLPPSQWGEQHCEPWKTTATNSTSSQEVKYVKAAAPYCNPHKEYRKADQANCKTEVRSVDKPHLENILLCDMMGTLYNSSGVSLNQQCYAFSSGNNQRSGSYIGNDAQGNAISNIHKYQCLKGQFQVKGNEGFNVVAGADAIKFLSLRLNHHGFDFRGKYIASDSYYTYSDGTRGYQSENKDICWTCAWVRYFGCFDPSTEITLADGTSKRIMDIVAGDEIYNPVTKKVVKVKSLLESNETQAMKYIKAGNKELKVTQGHPVYVARQGNIKASELKLGDLLVDQDGKEVAIEVLKDLEIDPNQRVINITLDANEDTKEHMLVANGLYSGDLYVQQKLAKQ